MEIKANYVVRFMITDQDLYDEFESGDGTLVRFLSAVLSNVRYSEDWTKRIISTYSDEIWWDDDNDHGIIDVEVTIDTSGLSEDFHKMMAEELETSTGINLDFFDNLSVSSIAKLFEERDEDGFGPLSSIVWWNTLIPKDENDDGSFLNDEDSPEYEEFFGRITNYPDTDIKLVSATYTNKEGNMIDLEGNYDYTEPMTADKLEQQIREYYPNLK